MRRFSNAGFTLIEMLVVIAIIAILVAIIIPTVTNATEKAKEAADAASIRSTVSEAVIEGLNAAPDVTAITKPVTMKQTDGFTTLGEDASICGIAANNACFKSATVEIQYTIADGTLTIGGVAASAN